MRELWKSEWIRFRGPAVRLALVHLVILGGMAFYGDLFRPSATKVWLACLAYALSGLWLGLYQVGSYRRQGLWSFLLHRPVAPARIFLALVAAGAMVLALVVVLPLLLITLALDVASSQWVDVRQYGLVLFVGGLVLTFYAGGCAIALRARWSALLLLVLALPFLNGASPGLWVFVPLAIALVWLVVAAGTAFQPDLAAPPRGWLGLLAHTLPTAAGLFPVVAFALTLLYSVVVIHREAGWRGFAVFAWNDYFPDGSYERAFYLSGRELVLHGLRLEDSPRSRGLAEWLEVLRSRDPVEPTSVDDLAVFDPASRRIPRRHALLFQEGETSLEVLGAHWRFSHDRMRFFGIDDRIGSLVGWIGPDGLDGLDGLDGRDGRGGDEAFADLAVGEGRQILAGGSLYRVHPQTGRVDLEVRLPPGERLLEIHGREGREGREAGSGWVAVSDRAVYLLEDRDDPEAWRRIPIPGRVENLTQASVLPLPGGHALVTFLMGRLSERDAYPARLVILQVPPSGAASPGVPVVDRSLEAGAPAWVRHRGFLVSPLLQAARDLGWRDRAAPRWRQVPAGVRWGALGLALLAVLLAAGLARRRRLSASPTVFWIALAFLFGLPGFFAFLLLGSQRSPDPST